MWPKDTYDEEGNYIYGKPGQCCRRKKGNKEARRCGHQGGKGDAHRFGSRKLKASEDADTAEAIAAADAHSWRKQSRPRISRTTTAHSTKSKPVSLPNHFNSPTMALRASSSAMDSSTAVWSKELPFHDEQGHLVIFWNTPEVHDWVQAQKESGTYKEHPAWRDL